MKLLTANFLSCPLRTCRSSPLAFPLHFRDCEIVRIDDTPAPAPTDSTVPTSADGPWDASKLAFTIGILKRVEWDALRTSAGELGFTDLPVEKPDGEAMVGLGEEGEAVLRRCWEVLVRTEVTEGALVCGGCGHEFRIFGGIANFLVPGHLV